GRTAQLIVAESIASYVGVDRDVNAVSRVQRIVSGANGKVVCANAAETGLPDDSADVVVGEAMLTMQGRKSKQKIVAEAKRGLSVG
ncbi:class I SAM-dependent methyltransferase, partial [Pauljensenia sp. UMB0018B]|nr:class I SAM-dependent methyltransferase [Pauljensenia sp. UMB0018B]